jgi:hypothetical protein
MSTTHSIVISTMSSRIALYVAAALLWLFFPAPAPAQHEHGPQGEKPPQLLPGLGSHTHPIETRNPEAQKFFDQGLTLLYGFNRYEALRSFRRASELDPQALMPNWGMGMARGSGAAGSCPDA